ncbi:MAG TPA: hypothetical protein VFV38_53150, partial [Ktedonobacteraceae bacterium]|nr:hypothetical protein [Ktedonobacteraceae bacterium]
LRPLMELLGRRECFHEALEYYERLCKILEAEECQPDAQTQDVAAFLRAKQLQRTHQETRTYSEDVLRPTPPLVEVLVAPHTPTLAFPKTICVPSETLFSLSAPSALAHMLPLEIAQDDGATWVGIRLAQILSFVYQSSRQALACDILQAILEKEIAMFDDMQGTSSEETFVLSRRQALITLAALPMMLASLLQGQSFALPPEEFLPQCAASITACWHLLRGQEFLLTEQLVTRYLPTLADLAHRSSSHQTGAASLASQGYRLMGILALHRNNPRARNAYWEQAVHFAEIAETPNLVASALISRAYYDHDIRSASLRYQRGIEHKEALSPLLLSRLYARLAVVSAQQGLETEALEFVRLAQDSYPSSPENDPTFVYADFDPASLLMETGLTYLALAQHRDARPHAQHAWETFTSVDHMHEPHSASARIRYEIMNHQARTTLMLNDLEAFCDRLEQGVSGAKALQSEKRRQEALHIYKEARILWPDETRIRSLADLFL